jgi:hypothetical protein
VSPELLERTRLLSATLMALLCMWLFGNLYEELVTNLQLIASPRPGTLVGEFAMGSPVYYYLPWTPLCVVLQPGGVVGVRQRHRDRRGGGRSSSSCFMSSPGHGKRWIRISVAVITGAVERRKVAAVPHALFPLPVSGFLSRS